MKAAIRTETFSQTMTRLMEDHGWDKNKAICAAEYYRGSISYENLLIRLGADHARSVANMR